MKMKVFTLNTSFITILINAMSASAKMNEATPYCGFKDTLDPWTFPFKFCSETAFTKEACEKTLYVGFGPTLVKSSCTWIEPAQNQQINYVPFCGNPDDTKPWEYPITYCNGAKRLEDAPQTQALCEATITKPVFLENRCLWAGNNCIAGISENNESCNGFLGEANCLAGIYFTVHNRCVWHIPTTLQPSPRPSPPTESPSQKATQHPTSVPTQPPTGFPTQSPTRFPTQPPSRFPTQPPTPTPTKLPTNVPTNAPTKVPTQYPTRLPTSQPTEKPTLQPTQYPTRNPTRIPTQAPTHLPTRSPTYVPSKMSSARPSEQPSAKPSNSPSLVATGAPSVSPSTSSPSWSPSKFPTGSPTDSPTQSPTIADSESPTNSPTENPTFFPSVLISMHPTKQQEKNTEEVNFVGIAVMAAGLLTATAACVGCCCYCLRKKKPEPYDDGDANQFSNTTSDEGYV